MSKYWKISNHVYGKCLILPNEDCLVLVPKNGSTLFKSLGLEDGNFLTKQYDRFHVFVRNPLQRWITGCCTYIDRYNVDFQNFINRLSDPKGELIFDEHTVPQNQFILKGVNTKFYDLENDLKYFNQEFNFWQSGYIPVINKYQKKPDHYDKLNFLVRNNVDGLTHRLLRLYEDDFCILRNLYDF